jgi:large subunit ribosomal protein L19
MLATDFYQRESSRQLAKLGYVATLTAPRQSRSPSLNATRDDDHLIDDGNKVTRSSRSFPPSDPISSVTMLRSLISPAFRSAILSAVKSQPATATTALFSTNSGGGVDPQDMPYLHHGKRPRFRDYTKFKSPRKRASNLLHQLTTEKMKTSIESNPAVWETKFRVGDAIEIQLVSQGGVKSNEYEKVRGVVLGIFRKHLDHSVLIRDVVFGQPLERRIPLHSPLIKSVKVLEENFIFKGRRKIKRAKLYYLSERNPVGKWILVFISRLLTAFIYFDLTFYCVPF